MPMMALALRRADRTWGRAAAVSLLMRVSVVELLFEEGRELVCRGGVFVVHGVGGRCRLGWADPRRERLPVLVGQARQVVLQRVREVRHYASLPRRRRPCADR